MKNWSGWLTVVVLLAAFCAGAYAGDNNSINDTRRTLEETPIDSLTWEDEPLSEVLSLIASITKVDFVPGEDVSGEEITVNLQLNRKTSVKELLKMLEKTNELKFWYSEGVVYVYKNDKILEKAMLKVYEVGNLEIPINNFPGPEMKLSQPGGGGGGINFGDLGSEEAAVNIPVEEIPDVIMMFTGDSGKYWEEAEDAVVEFRSGLLVVVAIPSVHVEVEKLLDMLRQ